MYKLLIFDWDGTIIDSTARIVACIQAAAKDLGLPHLQDHEAREIIGLGLREAVEALYPGIDESMIEPMKQRYAHHYLEANSTPTELFPGVKRTLESLRESGYQLAVATGKSRLGLDRVMAETGLGWLFETTRCADETVSKPDPLMINEILEELAVKPNEAIMIGDTEFDLGMAVSAGVHTIAVSYGAHHIDRLKQYDPLLEVHNFPEIETWLEGVNT